jgi:hypothetical protein
MTIKRLLAASLILFSSNGMAQRLRSPVGSDYRLTFYDDFRALDRISVDNNCVRGYTWYLNCFKWKSFVPSDSISLSNGGIVLKQGLITAGQSPYPDYSTVVGHAWGGGAYFEATMTFDPAAVFPSNGGWPAFFGISYEGLASKAQAPGQPAGYVHYGELDVMEYGFFNYPGNINYNFFWQTLHDFYGYPPPNQILNNGTSAISGGDLRGTHRYGALWTKGYGRRPGSVQAYFDGVPMGGPVTTGLVTWPAGQGNVIPPTPETAYSIFDLQHFALALQASPLAPVTVRNVQVWQTDRGTYTNP